MKKGGKEKAPVVTGPEQTNTPNVVPNATAVNRSSGIPDVGHAEKRGFGIYDICVATFASARGIKPGESSLGSVLEHIRRGYYSREITRLRKLRREDPEVYRKEKKKLPAFCISGTASSRTEPLIHSGLLQIDLDNLNDLLGPVRENLKADPHVAFGFVSPSGDGLKLGLRIDGNRHAESFEAATAHFRSRYGLEIDPAVKDQLRLCFVSHDPALWINEAAIPLAIPDELSTTDSSSPKAVTTSQTRADLSLIVLPSGDVSISESARVIFQRFAPTSKLFLRGSALVEIVTVDGIQGLEVLRPEKFCSDVEKLGPIFAWRAGRMGVSQLKPTHMAVDLAKRIMAASEARNLLPPVASVLRCPVLVETTSGDVSILGKGYHRELGGLLIVDGKLPPQVELNEAVRCLHWLVDEVKFQSQGDRSRGLAAYLTPALRLGGHIRGNIPIDCAEADESQAGKGYRHSLVSALYNETPYFVTSKKGGVGSVDESFQAALISARPFICLDNFRGRMDSQQLEAFLTCPSLFPARTPFRSEVLLDPKRFILQMSSNGLEATRDLANRAVICRIRKRPGFNYRDTLGELQRNQSYFLGCVFSVLHEWICQGKPRTEDTRHDFKEWSQTLDWIVQHILGSAPLLDGHEAAQDRTSNPALTWLRSVALAVARENRLDQELMATELVELCDLHAIEIPGKPSDGDGAKRKVGILCKQLFREGDTKTVDGFQVSRRQREYRKPSGDTDTGNVYVFTK